MLTIDMLKQFGANTEEGVGRCFGNEDFYLKLIKMMPGDANFGRLYDAIDAGNLESAFEAAHALKGALGNLSLTPLYEPIQQMTELLRSKTEMDYAPMIEEIKTLRNQLEALCAK